MRHLIIIVTVLTVLAAACKKEPADTTPPEIVLKGSSPFYVNKDSAYIEPGYTATDDVDGDITDKVVVSGSVDVHTEGTYYLKYNVEDKAGNKAEEKTREVRVTIF